MIIETILENGLVKRKSDIGLYIKNEQTGAIYKEAIDLNNVERAKRGLELYFYHEVEIPEDSVDLYL